MDSHEKRRRWRAGTRRPRDAISGTRTNGHRASIPVQRPPVPKKTSLIDGRVGHLHNPEEARPSIA